MGRIIIRDRPLKREVPTNALRGEIEIDLTGDEPTVVVPETVTVERRPAVEPAVQGGPTDSTGSGDRTR